VEVEREEENKRGFACPQVSSYLGVSSLYDQKHVKLHHEFRDGWIRMGIGSGSPDRG